MVRAMVLFGPGRGHRFEIPSRSIVRGLRHYGRYALGRYEPIVTAFLAERLRSRRVFFDIGAHTGYYTRVALNVMGSDGSVVAFEPDPDALAHLRTTFDDPRLLVRAEAAGRGDHVAVLERRDGAASRIRDESIAGPGFLTSSSVRVRALDELVQAGELPTPDILKVDVEGAEMLVLEGMSHTLERRPVLAIECHSVPLLNDVLSLVLGGGYQHVEVTRGGDGVGPPTVLAEP
jgi:FkbM family methyltransferase